MKTVYSFFQNRQIPETNHPAPQALDEKPSPSIDYAYDSPTETARNSCASPVPSKVLRRTIYEMSSDGEDDLNDNIRSPSDDDNDSQTFSCKDKDMRIPALFMDSKDSSNGDIDLRQLPFKPLPNYEPATEIDASYKHGKIIVFQVFITTLFIFNLKYIWICLGEGLQIRIAFADCKNNQSLAHLSFGNYFYCFFFCMTSSR